MEVREKNRIVVNKLVIQIGISVALLFSAVSRIASSHHSVSGFFDITKTLEIEGKATERSPSPSNFKNNTLNEHIAQGADLDMA